MRLLSTICCIILIILGSIVVFNIFAYTLGFFAVQREKKGKIILLLLLLLSVISLFIAEYFSTLKYINLYNLFIYLFFILLLILIIIIVNNIIDWHCDRYYNYNKIITPNNYANKNNSNENKEHVFFYKIISYIGLFYIFHEIFSEDNDSNHFQDDFYNDENYQEYDEEQNIHNNFDDSNDK